MPATLDANLGTKAQASSSTVSLVTSAAAAAGTLIVVGVGYFTVTAATLSITGTAGLTWANTTPTASGNLREYIFYAYAPSGLASGSTLTFTASAGSNDFLVGAGSFFGAESTPTLLASNGNAAASSGTWSAGSLAAGETNLTVVSVFEDGSGTATWGSDSPLTELIDFNNAGQAEAFTLAYNLSAAATATPTGTSSPAVTYVSKGASFRIASGTAPVPPGPQAPLQFPLLPFMQGIPLFQTLPPTTTAVEGSIDSTGSGIASAEAFGSHRVDLSVAGTGIGSAEAFGSGQVDLAILGTGIASAEAFGSHTVTVPSSGQTVNADTNHDGIASAEAFGSGRVDLSILGTGIASLEAFGSGQVNLQINGTGIGSGEAFGSNRVDLSILGTGIASAESFGSIDRIDLTITAIGITSGETFGSGVVTGGTVGAGSVGELTTRGYGL